MQCFLRRWNVYSVRRDAAVLVRAITPPSWQGLSRSARYLSISLIRHDPARSASSPPPAPLSTKSTKSASRRSRTKGATPIVKADANTDAVAADDVPENSRQQWQIQKAALKAKFGDEAWSPRKRLSPDALEGIRTMHHSDPYRFTTPVLAQHFEVSPEAIRRILKSKWQPSAEEQENRRERWERRGERVWSSLAEVGVKPPKPWRVRGVGKAEPGEVPLWKDRGRRGRGTESSPGILKEATTVRKGLVAEKSSTVLSHASTARPGKSISGRIL